MNKNLHDIDDLFKSSIDGHLEEAPPDVWKNIDHSLDKKQVAFFKKRYFVFRAAAILIILIGGVTIAAILHFRQPENSSNKNAVTTSDERKNKAPEETTIPKQAARDWTVENNQEKNTGLNSSENNNQGNQTTDRSNTTTITHQKNTSEEYGILSNDIYSAEKNRQLSVANKNKIRHNEMGKPEPVNKSSVDLVASNQNNSNKKLIEEANTSTTQTEAVKDVQRTTHVESSLLSIHDTVFTILNNWNRLPLSFSAPSTNSQTTRLKTRSGIWSIAPVYAQNISLNTLKDDDHFREPGNNSREAKRTEQETRNFSVGLSVQKQIGRNLSLQSGLQYFSSKMDIEPKTIFAKPDGRGDVRFRYYCSSGQSYLSAKNGVAPAVGDSIKTNFSKSEIAYLQLPLLIAYQINFGRLSLAPSAGIQTNFFLKGKLNSFLEHPTGEEEVSASIDGLRSTYFSGVIQPQLTYQLNDRLSLDFNPDISFSLTPINKGTAIKTYQNLFGFGAGVRIKL